MFLNFLLCCSLCFQSQKLEEASVSFEVTHLGALTVEGHFAQIETEMTKVSAAEWRIKGEIDVSSIDTYNDSRDETLLTEQYLNVKEFPTIPFEARLFSAGKKVEVMIDLEIRGIQTQLIGELYEEEGKLVSQQMTLDRGEIGLDFGLMDSLIGDEIRVVINSGIELSDLDW